MSVQGINPLRGRPNWPYRLLLLLLFGISIPVTSFGQDEFEAMAQRLDAKIEEYKRNPSMDYLGALTGLWIDKDENSRFPVTQIMHFKGVLMHSIVKASGELSMLGLAEMREDGWRGDLPAFFGPPITGEQRQSARLSRSRVLLGQREPASPASAHRHPSQHGAAL